MPALPAVTEWVEILEGKQQGVHVVMYSVRNCDSQFAHHFQMGKCNSI